MEDFIELHCEIEKMLIEAFARLRRTTVRNLAYLVIGLVMVLRTSRGWNGKLSLSGIARAMPTQGKVKIRYKRLHRSLDTPSLKVEELSSGFLRLVLPHESFELLPLVVDQTALSEVQVITGSYPVERRAIPVATVCFEYDDLKGSQNSLEESFLTHLSARVPIGMRVVWIMDRGYARAALLATCRLQEWLYIIRGLSQAIVEYREEGKIRKVSLGRLRHRQGVASRYRGVFYHGKSKERVDVIVYRDRGFKEPWFLLVPADSEDVLPTELVVGWYRARMNIEVSFRDFKSLLGVRGLRLKVRRPERLERLLAGLAIAYILLMVLGVSELGQQLRREIEVLRRKSRHGTRRTLSVLSIALMAVTDTFLLSRANLICVLSGCVLKLREGDVFVPRLSA